MLGWLLNLVYLVLLIAASPILSWRAVTQGKYRAGWSEKLLGRLPLSSGNEHVIWLHAVSVGEVLQLRTLVAALNERRLDLAVLITTTTVTGHAVARSTFPDCRIAYCPLDFTWSVRNALKRVRPTMIGLVELELWPNLIREATTAGIPLMLINGRMSASSYRRYRRVKLLMTSLLRRIDTITVQTSEYADRLIDLGADRDRLHVTGSVKFDGVTIDGAHEQSLTLRRMFRIAEDEVVFVAGSTHAPEESHVLEAWETLRADFPKLRLILVPRHQERFDEVAALVESRGLPLIRRSQGATGSAVDGRFVCLLDTLGELSACWELADVAFVGGSLTRRGGQNMIEPAAQGVPVIVGPHTFNFRDVVERLISVEGIQIISCAEDLVPVLRRFLTEPGTANRQGQAAQGFVRTQQGATDRTLALMLPLLPESHFNSTKKVA